MALFENFTKKVTETAKAVSKKSGDLVEVTKLNMSINTEQDKIEKVYAEMGKSVYELFSKGGDVEEPFRESCEKIKAYEKSIEEMKQKILETKNVKICTGCGTELELEIAFCPKCGAKQEMPQPPVQQPTEKTCADCGAVNGLEAAFCGKCGAKL
jgi:ribosomal protein L40E